MPNATPKFLLDMLNGEDSKDARITELERQLAKLTDDFTRQLDTLSSRNYELRMKNAGLERQLAELRSQPTDIVQRLNTALGEAFKDDPANAVRAHAAVLPLLLSQPTAQQVEDAELEYLNELDFAQLFRFNEICEDSDADGHDLSKEDVKRLCELGVLRSIGFGRHEITAFGSYVIEYAFLQKPKLPLKTTAEHNSAIAAMQAGKEPAK